MNRSLVYTVLAIIAIVILYAQERMSVFETDQSLIFQAERYVQSHELPLPPNNFTQDGCTLFPNRVPGHDFREACLHHDIAYWAGGPIEDRAAADVALRETISHTGPIGPIIGWFMYAGVRVFGDSLITKLSNANWGYGWNE